MFSPVWMSNRRLFTISDEYTKSAETSSEDRVGSSSLQIWSVLYLAAWPIMPRWPFWAAWVSLHRATVLSVEKPLFQKKSKITKWHMRCPENPWKMHGFLWGKEHTKQSLGSLILLQWKLEHIHVYQNPCKTPINRIMILWGLKILFPNFCCSLSVAELKTKLNTYKTQTIRR